MVLFTRPLSLVDVIRDTSDTESKSSNSGDEYEVEVEYEVASMSEDHDEIEFSTTDSEVINYDAVMFIFSLY